MEAPRIIIALAIDDRLSSWFEVVPIDQPDAGSAMSAAGEALVMLIAILERDSVMVAEQLRGAMT